MIRAWNGQITDEMAHLAGCWGSKGVSVGGGQVLHVPMFLMELATAIWISYCYTILLFCVIPFCVM